MVPISTTSPPARAASLITGASCPVTRPTSMLRSPTALTTPGQSSITHYKRCCLAVCRQDKSLQATATCSHTLALPKREPAWPIRDYEKSKDCPSNGSEMLHRYTPGAELVLCGSYENRERGSALAHFPEPDYSLNSPRRRRPGRSMTIVSASSTAASCICVSADERSTHRARQVLQRASRHPHRE